MMIQDIKEQERFGYGDECDKADWMRLLEELEDAWIREILELLSKFE